ncbi:DsbA family oxidoreductase [Actibacterium sp. MT2.3-13A]|uniref:DsbA family oxidoreductase n=1 Tax=Actibacterium sp. MT2.3-13A TaxID=2828332 RepID=UPI001BACE95C|nr:DsbA family oxidoreductase [Actibacterium sp. MT2.3-13A]
MVKLDILSDPICPWCYIGKTLLDRALAERPDHPFTIEWHPFQLNPDMPAQGMDRREYLETKFGGKEQAVRAYLPVHEAAAKAGLELDLGAITRTPNTLNAHRLIHWAGIERKQQAVVSFLFEAYFKTGQDIGDTEVLVAVAERAEMDGPAIRRLLEGDADAEAIRARDAHARARGVNGVPTFIVANQHVLTGAQPTELWRQVIDEISENLRRGAE